MQTARQRSVAWGRSHEASRRLRLGHVLRVVDPEPGFVRGLAGLPPTEASPLPGHDLAHRQAAHVLRIRPWGHKGPRARAAGVGSRRQHGRITAVQRGAAASSGWPAASNPCQRASTGAICPPPSSAGRKGCLPAVGGRTRGLAAASTPWESPATPQNPSYSAHRLPNLGKFQSPHVQPSAFAAPRKQPPFQRLHCLPGRSHLRRPQRMPAGRGPSIR
jgi:hypothetical protein